MMKRFNFPVTIEPGDDWGYVVTYPDISFAVTQGDNLEDAKIQAADCLDEAIAAMITNSWDIPFPSEIAEFNVSVSLPLAAKAYLYLALREVDIQQKDLEEQLNWNSGTIAQLLDPKQETDFDRIETVLAVLGKKLNLELVDAA